MTFRRSRSHGCSGWLGACWPTGVGVRRARALCLTGWLLSERRECEAVGAGAVDERVARALARVRERDRELLMLVAWEGLSHAEVAQALGIRLGTLAVRLHRARQQFAQALAAEDAAMRTEVPR